MYSRSFYRSFRSDIFLFFILSVYICWEYLFFLLLGRLFIIGSGRLFPLWVHLNVWTSWCDIDYLPNFSTAGIYINSLGLWRRKKNSTSFTADRVVKESINDNDIISIIKIHSFANAIRLLGNKIKFDIHFWIGAEWQPIWIYCIWERCDDRIRHLDYCANDAMHNGIYHPFLAFNAFSFGRSVLKRLSNVIHSLILICSIILWNFLI